MQRFNRPHIILFVFTIAALIAVYIFVTYVSDNENTDHMAFLFPIVAYSIWMLLFGNDENKENCDLPSNRLDGKKPSNR